MDEKFDLVRKGDTPRFVPSLRADGHPHQLRVDVFYKHEGDRPTRFDVEVFPSPDNRMSDVYCTTVHERFSSRETHVFLPGFLEEDVKIDLGVLVEIRIAPEGVVVMGVTLPS